MRGGRLPGQGSTPEYVAAGSGQIPKGAGSNRDHRPALSSPGPHRRHHSLHGLHGLINSPQSCQSSTTYCTLTFRERPNIKKHPRCLPLPAFAFLYFHRWSWNSRPQPYRAIVSGLAHWYQAPLTLPWLLSIGNRLRRDSPRSAEKSNIIPNHIEICSKSLSAPFLHASSYISPRRLEPSGSSKPSGTPHRRSTFA